MGLRFKQEVRPSVLLKRNLLGLNAAKAPERSFAIVRSEDRTHDLFARLNMRACDWVVLLAISMMVGVLGVLGVSYVVGQGWPLFSGALTAVLCVAATVIAAVVLLAADQGLFWLATCCKVDSPVGGACSNAAQPADVSRVEGTPSLGASSPSDVSSGRRSRLRSPSRLSSLTPSWNARSIAKFSLIMALLWLPWLIANFPGGTYWDTYYQIFQCYPENHPIAIIPYAECYDNTLTDAYFCDHHPLFDTLVYGAFGMASDALTGNWMAGVFAFVCLQGAAHVVAFTAAVAYMRARRCPVVLCFAAYVFLCVMPFVSTWALCMVKDSLFGLFYISYLIMLFEVVRTRGASLENARTVVLFALVGLMLCLTKKTGLYVVVPTALVAAWVYREHWRALAAQALLSLVVMCVMFPLLVFPLLNVAPGGKQEVLGPLFQQTAYYVTYFGQDVTDEEREAIDAVLEYDNLASQYTFDFQDEVKYRFKLDSTTDDLASYLRTWAAQGTRHPEAYVGALMSIAGFYTAPVAPANIRMVTVDTHMGDDDRYMLWNPDELDWLRNGMADAYNAVARTPVLDAPLLVVVYVFWLPAVLMFVMWRRRTGGGVLLVPPLVLLAFCVIAPVFDARYCVPLFDGAPLMVCMVASLLRAQCGPAELAGLGGSAEPLLARGGFGAAGEESAFARDRARLMAGGSGGCSGCGPAGLAESAPAHNRAVSAAAVKVRYHRQACDEGQRRREGANEEVR